MSVSILITGCSTGIGYFCAKRLHIDGYKVYATVKNEQDIAKLQAEGLRAYKLDVTSAKDIASIVDLIAQDNNGKLDILFNNAGYGQPGSLEDLPLVALKEQFETNLFGNFALTQAMLPCLRRSVCAKIIQNSSVLGFVSLKYRGAYNASKYALEGLSDTMRLELAPFGIAVSLIEPGPIVSKFRKNAYDKFKQHISIEQSHYKDDYLQAIKRFESSELDPFTLGESAVYDIVVKIIKTSKPKARYRVTFPTTLFWFLKRVTSTKVLDWVLQKV
jgi:NAD(P)-dependent dehydrogenase (short-subunit alcohol dehydrogenase family)